MKIYNVYKTALKQLWGQRTIERKLYDKHCMIRAYRILNQDVYIKRYDGFFLDRTIGHFKKQPVLIALGRILEQHSKDTMIELADTIYEQRMTTKAALKFIRQYSHTLPLPAPG